MLRDHKLLPARSASPSSLPVICGDAEKYITAIALQTGRAKDRGRVARLLESEAVDWAVLDGVFERNGPAVGAPIQARFLFRALRTSSQSMTVPPASR